MRENTSEEIERAIHAQELTEILAFHSLRINAEISEFQLSPLVIYCSKTGQPIGELKTATLYAALEIQGRETLREALYQNNGASVHPAWRKTGSNEQYNEILDKLCEHDPYGYAVYSLGFVTQEFYKLHNSRKFKTREHAAEFHWSLARAWQILSLVPREKIVELNDALCHLLVYAPSSLRYLQRLLNNRAETADGLARCALAGNLTKDISNAIERTLQGVGQTHKAIDRSDFVEHAKKLKAQYETLINPSDRQKAALETARETLKSHYAVLTDIAQGPTQFRKQRNAHRKILDRELKIAKEKELSKRQKAVNELAAEFGMALFGTDKPIRQSTQSSSISSRFTRWNDIEQELKGLPGDETISPEFLAALDMGEIALPGETAFGSSDGPEFRTISWDELRARQAQREAEEAAKIQAQLDAAPRISFLQRIAPKAVEIPKAELPAFFRRFQK